MRLISKVALVGLGAATLAGGALAAERAIHTLNVTMPDGTVEQIRYVGDEKPVVRFVPVAAPGIPIAVIDPDFASFDRMFADMKRQHQAMMRQVAAMQRQIPVAAHGKIDEAALKALPAGMVHYSFVSTNTGNGSCTQSFEMTSYGKNQRPRVVQHSSSDCTAMGRKPVPAVATPAPAPAKVTPVKAQVPVKTVDPNTI